MMLLVGVAGVSGCWWVFWFLCVLVAWVWLGVFWLLRLNWRCGRLAGWVSLLIAITCIVACYCAYYLQRCLLCVGIGWLCFYGSRGR